MAEDMDEALRILKHDMCDEIRSIEQQFEIDSNLLRERIIKLQYALDAAVVKIENSRSLPGTTESKNPRGLELEE